MLSAVQTSALPAASGCGKAHMGQLLPLSIQGRAWVPHVACGQDSSALNITHAPSSASHAWLQTAWQGGSICSIALQEQLAWGVHDLDGSG